MIEIFKMVLYALCLYFLSLKIFGWIISTYFPTALHKQAQQFITANVSHNDALTTLKMRGGLCVYTSNRYPCELCFEVIEISPDKSEYHLHIDGILHKGDGNSFADHLASSGQGEGQIFVVVKEDSDLIHACLNIRSYTKKIELPWEKYGGIRRKKRLKLPWELPVLRPAFQPAQQPV